MNDQQNNPFKQYHTNHEVPMEIKAKLMKDLTLFQLFGEIADLFSGKMGNTAMELFKMGKNNNQ